MNATQRFRIYTFILGLDLFGAEGAVEDSPHAAVSGNVTTAKMSSHLMCFHLLYCHRVYDQLRMSCFSRKPASVGAVNPTHALPSSNVKVAAK